MTDGNDGVILALLAVSRPSSLSRPTSSWRSRDESGSRAAHAFRLRLITKCSDPVHARHREDCPRKTAANTRFDPTPKGFKKGTDAQFTRQVREERQAHRVQRPGYQYKGESISTAELADSLANDLAK